jgi:PrtD family type I secretion system ABC transporter
LKTGFLSLGSLHRSGDGEVGVLENRSGATPAAEGDGADRLLLGLMRLCDLQGCPVGEAEARAALSVPPGGRRWAAAARLAERQGLAARLEPATRRRLNRLRPPFLLIGRRPEQAWLVRARTGGKLQLHDPCTGEVTRIAAGDAARLAARLLQVAAMAERRPQPMLRRMLLGRLRRPLLEIGLASTVLNLMALATPIFMMTVYNKVIGHGALATLDVLAIGMLTLMGFEAVLRGLRGQVAAHAGARLDALIGGEVVRHVLHLPYRSFETAPAGQLAERLRQLDQLRAFLTGGLPLLAVDLVFVGLFVTALFVLSPSLGWLTLAAAPVFALLALALHRRESRLGQDSFRTNAARSACLGEAMSQALTVKALGLETEALRRYERRLRDSALAGLRIGSLTSLFGGAGQAVQHVTALLLIYVGARMVVAGDLSVGALVACNILAARALAPIRQLFGAWGQLVQAREAHRRLDALMAEATEPAGSTGGELRGHLRLEGVSFRYAPDRPWALRDVDLEIAPGTMLGIVGAPGSGKSTLVKLLLGLERPAEGRILLDDVDLRRLRGSELRRRLGVVPQEVQLFQGSIAENIGMGTADATPERVVAAARFVGLHGIVERLPDGYDTRLGERGAGLSAGQRQLVALARAVVRNPRLLVLDEATSALDTAAEARLVSNLRRAGSGRTIVLVTHRLSLLQACDCALLLRDGRVARAGSPAEIAASLQAEGGRPGLQVAS